MALCSVDVIFTKVAPIIVITTRSNKASGKAKPLVVMTIMGATLVNITSTEHNANTNKDSNQQAFYAAESGISVAKSWMVGNISKSHLRHLII